MDATRRWETEALRTSSQGRPRPSGSRRASSPKRDWVTLKEAEADTGIPANTLRKWVRKDAIPSYLESEGDFVLRMVDLDAVKDRATKLGRRVEPLPDAERRTPGTRGDVGGEHPPQRPEPGQEGSSRGEERQDEGQGPQQAASSFPEDPPRPELPPDTMLVPVDAWNKMLAQLGNLHDAGQQLAEARERAAKAETEAQFLRERLADLRGKPDTGQPTPDAAPAPGQPEADHSPVDDERAREDASEPATPTTTYWRYLTAGWRDRRRRNR